jgi:hypothetical protein
MASLPYLPVTAVGQSWEPSATPAEGMRGNGVPLPVEATASGKWSAGAGDRASTEAPRIPDLQRRHSSEVIGESPCGKNSLAA